MSNDTILSIENEKLNLARCTPCPDSLNDNSNVHKSSSPQNFPRF